MEPYNKTAYVILQPLTNGIVGSILRLYLFYNIPEELAGLDTMIPPVVSLLVIVPVSLMTQKSHPPKHHVIAEIPDDADVLAGRA